MPRNTPPSLRAAVLLWAALPISLIAADDAAPTIVPTDMFSVPDGLEVTVWAHTPLLRNPTNMDIDRDGRIWVAEGVNYRKHAGRDPLGQATRAWARA